MTRGRPRLAQLALRVAFGGLAATSYAGVCRADATPSTVPESARILFHEGRKLATDGKYAEACPKFEQSLAIDSGLGTKFNLADCWEHLGRLASAKALFDNVASHAHESGQTDRELAARARAAALVDQLPHLVIQVAEGGLEVRRDGVVVGPTSWNTPEPIDPGTYEITATSPGKKAWTDKAVIPATTATITVVVPKLADDGPAPPAPVAKGEKPEAAEPTTTTDTEPPASPPADAPEADQHRSLNTAQIALFATAGVGALLAGSAFLTYGLRNNEAKQICPTNTNCTMSDIGRHQELIGEARTARALGFVGLGVGAAAAVGAVVVTMTGKPAHESAHGFQASPVVGQGLLGAEMAGTF